MGRIANRNRRTDQVWLPHNGKSAVVRQRCRGDLYGIRIPETKRALFENPVVQLAHEIPGEDGCLGIVGTSLTSFLSRRCVFGIEEVHDMIPEQLKREEEARNALQEPRYLWPDEVRKRYIE